MIRIKPLVFFIIIFLSAINISYSQTGYTLLDSCCQIHDLTDTNINRTLLFITDTGRFTIGESWDDANGVWDTFSIATPILYIENNIYDSLNRVITTERLVDSTGQWQFYNRTTYSYDAYGRMTDSTEQIYFGNSWNNSYRTDWTYDSIQQLVMKAGFTGNGNLWTADRELHMVHSIFGVVDSFRITYSGAATFNDYKVERFYQAYAQDTMKLNFNGNLNQWDSTDKFRRVFDASGNLILETHYIYNAGWLNISRETFNYDIQNRAILHLAEIGDSIGGWSPGSRDSTYYDSLATTVNHTSFSWNGSMWVCHEFDNFSYNSPSSYHETAGMLDPTDCTIDGLYYDQDRDYDSLGRLIYFNSNSVGVGEGYSYFKYDDDGFLYSEYHNGTTMGGLTNENYCVHYKPLVFNFDNYALTKCVNDSVSIISYPSGGAYQYNYRWTFNQQLLNNSLSTLTTTASHSGWYTLTVTDTAGNFYMDSVRINVHPDPNLGSDSILCVNQTLVLFPGNFSSYIWFDGSMNQSITINSPTADTINCWVTVTDTSGCSNSDSSIIVFSLCQQVEELISSRLTIFPNPSSDYVTINVSSSLTDRIEIYNSLGQLQKPEIFSGKSELVDISGLPAGVYFVRVIVKGVCHYGRFVRE